MKKSRRLDPGSLNDLIDELTAEAGSDDEQIWNLRQALQKNIWLPCEGFVIGEGVSVIAFEFDGNQRRAVTATCRCADGRQYEVATSEVVIPPNLSRADCLVPTANGWDSILRFEESACILDRILWLNPSDNQGAVRDRWRSRKGDVGKKHG